MASPVLSGLSPANAAIDVLTSTPLQFDITDADGDLTASSVVIEIDKVVVYGAEVTNIGWLVTRTVVANGYRYVVTPQRALWSYARTHAVEISAEDGASNTLSQSVTFTVATDSTCFDGSTLNTTELVALNPFTSAAAVELEVLRQELLRWAAPTAVEAVRCLYLWAFDSELESVMRDLVPTPTAAERAVRLCHKATVRTVSESLRSKEHRFSTLLDELRALGLPLEHAEMFDTYSDSQDPSVYTALHCLFLFLAKALESTALVA